MPSPVSSSRSCGRSSSRGSRSGSPPSRRGFRANRKRTVDEPPGNPRLREIAHDCYRSPYEPGGGHGLAFAPRGELHATQHDLARGFEFTYSVSTGAGADKEVADEPASSHRRGAVAAETGAACPRSWRAAPDPC